MSIAIKLASASSARQAQVLSRKRGQRTHRGRSVAFEWTRCALTYFFVRYTILMGNRPSSHRHGGFSASAKQSISGGVRAKQIGQIFEKACAGLEKAPVNLWILDPSCPLPKTGVLPAPTRSDTCSLRSALSAAPAPPAGCSPPLAKTLRRSTCTSSFRRIRRYG